MKILVKHPLAFVVVSDPKNNYGKIRVLQLPRNTTIPGPTQVQNNFESDPDVSALLSLLRRGGSEVELGNLLSLPIASAFFPSATAFCISLIAFAKSVSAFPVSLGVCGVGEVSLSGAVGVSAEPEVVPNSAAIAS